MRPVVVSVTFKRAGQSRRPVTWIRPEDGIEFFLVPEEDRPAVIAQKPLVVIRPRSNLGPPGPDQFECAHIVRRRVLRTQQIQVPFSFTHDFTKFDSSHWSSNINSFNLWPLVPKDHRT